MTQPAIPNFHDVRLAARAATYPNRSTEDASVREVETWALNLVRRHEEGLVDQKREMMTAHNVDAEAATDAIAAMRVELRRPLESGELPTPQQAARFQQLRNHSALAIQSLERAARRAEFLADKLEDVYSDARDFYDRFSVVRPAYRPER